jgi:uncharacterized protein involved in exopolysaccharide biosynthesis
VTTSHIRQIEREAGSIDGVLTMAELWRILISNRHWVFGFPVLFGLIALGYGLLAQPQWEAAAILQVGRIPQIQQANLDPNGALIEPVAKAIERLKLPAFRDGTLVALGVGTQDPKAGLYRNSLRLRQLPNTDLIELRIRGFSREDAREFARLTVERLAAIHGQVAQPTLLHLRSLLEEVERELDQATVARDKLSLTATRKDRPSPGERFSENVLLASILEARDDQIRQLKERRLLLIEMQAPQRTFPTSLIDDVFVPTTPVWPRPWLSVGLAAAAGLLAGVTIALISAGLQRRTQLP